MYAYIGMYTQRSIISRVALLNKPGTMSTLFIR